MSDAAERFDPRTHVIKLQGKDYLEVAWRIAWLRDVHPDAVMTTDLISLDEVPGKRGEPTERAIFSATVTLPTGGAATGYGSETRDDFPDHLEKASTKAIGRALAALGFGTQFAPDMEDGAAEERPVDAPVRRRATQRPGRGEMAAELPEKYAGVRDLVSASDGASDDQEPRMAQPGQINAISSLWLRLGRDVAKLPPYLFEQFAQTDPAALTQEEAGKVIGQLDKEYRLERAAAATG